MKQKLSLLENIIHSAFGFSEYWGVDKVYPKRQVTEEYIVIKYCRVS